MILSTYDDWTEFGRSSSYYCFRLGRNIPIMAVHLNNTLLLELHRYLFVHFKGRYDYYVNQEDDVLIKPQHLQYYIKWETFYEPTKTSFIPGFWDFELPTRLYKGTHKFKLVAPIVQEMFFYLFYFKNSPTVMFRDHVHRFFIISNDVLRVSSTRDDWFGDSKKPFIEPNVHYQSRWLNRHYRVVVPVEDFYEVLTHHCTDKYVHHDMDKKGEKGLAEESNHNWAVAVPEVYSLILHLLAGSVAASTKHQPWNITVVPQGGPGINPLTCMKLGRAALITPLYNGSLVESLRTRSSTVLLKAHGSCVEQTAMSRQVVVPCALRPRSKCHPKHQYSRLHKSPGVMEDEMLLPL